MTTPEIVVLVSSIILGICIRGIYVGRKKPKHERLERNAMYFVFLTINIVFGLIMIPNLLVNSTEYEELNCVEIVKTNNKIIIDGIKCEQLDLRFHAFNSYEAVTSINDSTKFYVQRMKNIYGFNLSSKLAWSNAPYEKYNLD